MRFSIDDFLSKGDQIRRKLRVWSHLLKKSIMENFILRHVKLKTVISFILVFIKLNLGVYIGEGGIVIKLVSGFTIHSSIFPSKGC